MHHVKLHRAINPDGQSVLATEALSQNEDTYFCPCCGCAVILHPHNHQKAWFKHDEREVAETSGGCIYLSIVK
ncbi:MULTISPECIES: DUF7828 domain-containing protein [unclassified Serratia (in: enterobacteria)]|uniref:DUF7828 domain-containing protein n=1 Tax=unclassified Serratia (in: enterobacteria) TaxID=2647522 RepID=UPI003FA790C2